MASIFTYQEEPHRVHSPWSTPGSSTPQIAVHVQGHSTADASRNGGSCNLSKLEPEKHDGPIEYKLHLLLRWRRTFTYSSTTVPVWSKTPDRLESASAFSPSTHDGILPRSTYQPSTQTRQARLQQLTTQLLWRLQQSSPFHSSSNAKLVLPVLPEATPRLGVPDRPSKLLPGLEESQGALYEIGVADDGTLVGLADEEMEESLINLRAMAASLGCVLDVHRRVVVGECEWVEESVGDQPSITRTSKLWVAEVLVRPDNKSVEVIPADAHNAPQAFVLQEESSGKTTTEEESTKQHLRVALVGASAAGKSSLLGTLTTSVLDNGRGKSRLSLLKHRHEIASGITSSVAQELLGYDTERPTKNTVVNYATGDVSSWPDVHSLANRLVFLSDSPGLPRYSKSTFRALISWDPTWTVLCIAADDDMQNNIQNPADALSVTTANQAAVEPSLSLAHLELCLKLGRLFVVAITKMDAATKSGLKQVLGRILSMVKAAGKFPVVVNAPATQTSRKDDTEFSGKVDELVIEEQSRMDEKLASIQASRVESSVPIILTSAVSGSGIASLHAMLRALPTDRVAPHSQASGEKQVIFRIDEVFAIPPSKVYSTSADRAATDNGVVLCGLVSSGTVTLGDELLLGPFLVEADTGEPLQVRALRRASSHHSKPIGQPLSRSLSENFSKSLQLNEQGNAEPETQVRYAKVKVVSLRNLRLSVTSMHAGDTGTVGIQAIDTCAESTIALDKARKGMILARSPEPLRGYKSFTATFPYSDFGGSASPPLILGGHAIAYIHSIRAPVKVTAVALEDDDRTNQLTTDSNGAQVSTHDEVFSFEDDDAADDADDINAPHDQSTASLRISFKFVTTVEYLEKNDQVLIVPNVTPAGPVTGPPSTSTIPGFSGFVGRICEMHV
ncbi:hypothetical protein OHC33_002467 [Knufia fluminis]|uniref:Tr-type G domain-containing protein n=1 Tax=Knufia fluminis TaxID=191047 RepID=A0AAN8ER68_9EURO|nr:hypothetical protein OHC33_002467 [Knufia fluminis]